MSLLVPLCLNPPTSSNIIILSNVRKQQRFEGVILETLVKNGTIPDNMREACPAGIPCMTQLQIKHSDAYNHDAAEDTQRCG